MVKSIDIKISFLQPVRVVPWQPESKRKTDRAYMRGGAYARWHMMNDQTDHGRPYITGSFLRSALLTELEKMLHSHNPYNCCAIQDQTYGNNGRPCFLRKRAVLPYKTNLEKCSPQKPCLLCLLKGRYDKKKRRAKINPDNPDDIGNFSVHFSNLTGQAKSLRWKSAIRSRVVNRVDPESGKAQDFFTIHEIEPEVSGQYTGTITINDSVIKEEIENLKALIASGLAHVKVIAGAVCRVDITNESHESLIQLYFGPENSKNASNNEPSITLTKPLKFPEPPALPTGIDLENLADSIAFVFSGGQKAQKVRFVADVIRELRQHPPDVIRNLPRGKNVDQHFLWDHKPFSARQSLREILFACEAYNLTAIQWRYFCDTLGQNIYDHSKRLVAKPDAPPRLLGETEYFGLPLSHETRYVRETEPPERIPFLKWTMVGNLKAESPFFFGVASPSSQTSDTILLTSEGHFRLPSSVIRGALRRDLRVVIKDGCNMPLGGTPCDCPVCRIMKTIVVEDGISNLNLPPEIRHRIRLNPHLGTVAEGALFDMETGFQGVFFPFRLHVESYKAGIDSHLRIVLNLWEQGKAFMGGNLGAGFGLFSLQSLKYRNWSLNVLDNSLPSHQNYLLCRGYAALETTAMSPEDKTWKKLKTHAGAAELFSWEKISLKFTVNTPLLSRDRLRAMMDPRNPDSLMFVKHVFIQKDDGTLNEKPISRFAIKGESFRGLVRHALAGGEYGQNDQVFDRDHEECDCIQCKLFGNVHQQGRLRFMDLEILPESSPSDRKMDHVAIDRFTGGGINAFKYDDYPIIGRNNTLTLSGAIWVHKDCGDDEKIALCKALGELRDGLHSLGGLASIGYGGISKVEFTEKPACLELPENCLIAVDISKTKRHASAPIPEVNLKETAIYHPHTFLAQPKGEIDRIKDLVSHVSNAGPEGESLFSGRIRCTLETAGPVFTPETNKVDYFGMAERYPGHKNYGFFRINGQLAIPGSTIRGMISSVYEAITNSCYRVFDQSRYLTRSSDANATENFKPGRIIRLHDGSLGVKQLEEIYRLPLYDQKATLYQIDDNDFRAIDATKLAAAKFCNENIAAAAEHNRRYLKGLDKESRETILQGIKPVWFKVESSHGPGGFPHDKIIKLYPENSKNKKLKKGYIKFTGPSMVNTEKIKSSDGGKIPSCDLALSNTPTSLWAVVETTLHNDIHARPSLKKKYPRPRLYCENDEYEFSMIKRCEQIFEAEEDQPIRYSLPLKVLKQYNDSRWENEDNTKTLPPAFRTWTPGPQLREGDLVYFLCDNNTGTVTRLAPVRIARRTDSLPMGKRFGNENASKRPCLHECIEDCDQCPDRCGRLSNYFLPHPLGLCPACHLFGTPFYKGRVGFHTAWIKHEPKWYVSEDSDKARGGALTLRLQERPRPTWSMPKDTSEIPGRKFFLHHPWSVESISETPNKNNTTVEPLAKGNEFKFDVRFHHLRKWELGLLMYALELEDSLAHKLGMGKALGLGSIRIKLSELHFKSSKETGYQEKNGGLLKKELIEAGLDHLKILVQLENGFKNILGHPYLKNLRTLLWLPESKTPKVRYPALESEEGIPGYMDLQKIWSFEERRKILTTPWAIWFDPSTSDSRNQKEKTEPEDGSGQSDHFEQSGPSVHPPDKTKQKGTVEKFDKGFGFIRPDTGGKNIFFHFSAIQMEGYRKLAPNDRVEFTVTETSRGIQADSVWKLT